MREIVICIGGILMGIIWTLIFTFHNKHDYVLKSKILETAPTTWIQQTFTCSDIMQTTEDGETHFYSAKIIDAWVDRMNKVLTSN